MLLPPSDQGQKLPATAGRPRQRGAAIITAMLIVGLVATLATTLLTRMNDWIEDLAIARDKAQATELARNGVAYARQLLIADAAHSAIDTLDEDWARTLPPMHHEGAELSGRIVDVQGRFNLNNLRRASGIVDEQAHAAYQRLLIVLGLPAELADTLADWLDADDSRRTAGAEASDYATAGEDASGIGRPLSSSGELLRVRGYTPAIVARLQPHICVLADIQAINVNTATPEVLSAIQPGLTPANARILAAGRHGLPFRDSSDFRNRLADPGLPSSLLPISATSRHFLVEIEVDRKIARSRVSSLLQRGLDGSRPRILWQSIL